MGLFERLLNRAQDEKQKKGDSTVPGGASSSPTDGDRHLERDPDLMCTGPSFSSRGLTHPENGSLRRREK
jgi:hypothetical protein